MSDRKNAIERDGFFGLLGIKIVSSGEGKAHLKLDIGEQHIAPNGYLHAGAVVSLADSAAGAGCMAHLPEAAQHFTTIELKTNLIGTARAGTVHAYARCLHAGRTTQVWDVAVESEQSSKTIAEFRCTQLIIY